MDKFLVVITTPDGTDLHHGPFTEDEANTFALGARAVASSVEASASRRKAAPVYVVDVHPLFSPDDMSEST